MHIAVIGGGAFGAMTAIKLAECGQTVTLFERLPSLMQGATFNANRLHLGFHYPRDEETALQCMRGFEIFKREFSPAILPEVTNAYFIASEGSLTSPRSFLAFCRRLGLRHQEIEPDAMHPRVSNVDLGLMTDEVMFDGATLCRLMNERLAGSATHVRPRRTRVRHRRRSWRCTGRDQEPSRPWSAFGARLIGGCRVFSTPFI